MTQPLTGYGADTWCTDRYAPGRIASRRLVVAQALYRRITTPRGTLQGGEEESAYGIDVSEYCGAVDDDSVRAAVPTIVRAEILKDDRVVDAAVTVRVDSAPSLGPTARQLVITVVVSLVEEELPLTLTVGVDALNVQLLGVVT